eukprot:TRINITY_DN8275_c0_g2_i1.p1 TRINITY_DN8275_c0_g2~~TRINITY_DN8275_c0_g2_i1.p1  ORF type:complete len:182 (-),score=30.09 TRINITY_DN8275_c0_g2_i1:33-578(-)
MWDRGAPSQVVETPRSARLNPDNGPQWQCESCGRLNGSMVTHCTKCSMLRKEERELRMVARSGSGLGRGGGYFERSEDSGGSAARSRKKEDKDLSDTKGGLDVYGRIRDSKNSKNEDTSARRENSRNSKDSKSERQKAALERLRTGARKDLSPPKPTHFREKSSRSRSLERRRESKRVFNY